jgi:DNA invertase Pin-like site-specific DNA recombinase
MTNRGSSTAEACIMRYVIYARYSSSRQSPESIPDQMRKCREYAAARGWQEVAPKKTRSFLAGALTAAEFRN